MQDRIISALIGLVGACSSNPKTENTDEVIVGALRLADSSDDIAADDMLEKIYTEKNAVAPGCAVCKTPCGNTSDYDISRLYNAPVDVRDAKLAVISEISDTAKMPGTALLDTEIFYKAVAYVGYDLSADILLDLVGEILAYKNSLGWK